MCTTEGLGFLKAIYRNHCGSRVARKSGKITATRSARRPRAPNSGSLKFPLSLPPSPPAEGLQPWRTRGAQVRTFARSPSRARRRTREHAAAAARRGARMPPPPPRCLPARLQAAAAARSGTGRARRGGGGGAAAAARRRRRPALIYRAGRGAHPRRTTPLFKRFQ